MSESIESLIVGKSKESASVCGAPGKKNEMNKLILINYNTLWYAE